MASRPRRIAAAEWDSHKDTILNLRQSGVSINGEDGIVARMEKDYEFKATPAQYELQLSKWGDRKNINANEWRRTLQVVDQYNEDGIKCAVYKNGELVRPLILRKKRNQHCKGQEYARFRRNRVSSTILPECIQIKISESQTGVAGMIDVDGDEKRDEDGDEDELTSEPYNLAMTMSETTPVFPNSHLGAVDVFDMGSSYFGNQMPTPNPLFEESNQAMDAMSALANDDRELEPSAIDSVSHFPSDALSLDMDCYIPTNDHSTSVMVSPVRDNPATGDMSLIGPDTPLNAVSSLGLVDWWTPNIQSPRFNEFLESRGYQSLGASPELPFQQAVLHRQSHSLIDGNARESGGSPARQFLMHTRPLPLQGSPLTSIGPLLYAETIGVRLSSLLTPDVVSSNFPLNSRTSARHEIFGSSIYGSLILSVENNFAGFDGVPIGSVLKLLEQDPQMRPRLSKYLRATPKNVSKTLAKNLFRAAIENCDALTVTELLKTELVTPNDIVCSVYGRRYTAVERSAMLHSIEVTKALLTAGADINKTYTKNPLAEKGALELAIQKRGMDVPMDMQLVNMLLDHGAKVGVGLAATAVRRQDPVLIRAIMPRISPYDHPKAFRKLDIMVDAVRLLDGELATTIIEQIVQTCYQSNCGNCSKAYSDILQKSMALAAMRGHSRLVAFLVDYVADKGPPLACAVRSGKRDMIELLLKNGASADAPKCTINKDDGFFTTPFAEAIRAEDDKLIHQFHGLGATTQISEEGRFSAAIYAASEVGNLTYVNELLQMAPGMGGNILTLALTISIRKGHEEVALTLLKAGADVNGWPSLSTGQPLVEALRQKSKSIVLTIMDCDVEINPLALLTERLPSSTSFMEAAARWGDVSIVKDLLSMGAKINAGHETAVAVAVSTKNRPLVEFLVKNGARLDVRGREPSSRRRSPLVAAISNKDIDMIRYLIDLGADPSCSCALNEAVEKGGEILAVVLDAFRKFPKYQKGFGAEALQSAIEKDDVELVDLLLEAEFDVNAFAYTKKYGWGSALGKAIERTGGSNLDIIRKLILAGGEPNSIVSSASINQHTFWPRRTAMLQAILTKIKPLVELLIDEGADIKRAARLGLKRTPLQQACEVGVVEVIDLLLEKGVDVNEAPALRGGATSLQLCAIKGYCGMAEKLLKRGADVHAVPSEINGRTALDGAAEHGRLDMLVLLWNATAHKRFSPEQCSHAMKLAEENGHIACCDLLRRLDLTSRDFLKSGRLST